MSLTPALCAAARQLVPVRAKWRIEVVEVSLITFPERTMTVSEPTPSVLPPHVEGTVQAIAQLYLEHHQHASRAERVIDRATSMIGRPSFLGVLVFCVASWIAINLAIPRLAFDPPPFAWLVGLIALVSLFMTTLILISQRRADELASRREQMTLEVSILSEQKAAKIIELLEELRRDSPNVLNRVDSEAEEMAEPADARAVLEVIQATHEEMKEGYDAAGSGVSVS